MSERYYATGKRKTSIARVWLMPGSGNIIVNGKSFDEYFDVDTAKLVVDQPFKVTGSVNKFDVKATVKGGGKTGQCEALRHGIARALQAMNEEYRTPLKKAGLLTRDARIKERKKYGLHKARKAPQFSKR